MSSCVDLKPPDFWRCSTMRAASFSPTPGSAESSDADAVLRLTLPVGAALWTRAVRVDFADEAGFAVAVCAAKLVVETRAASARARPPARNRFIFMTALLYGFEFPNACGKDRGGPSPGSKAGATRAVLDDVADRRPLSRRHPLLSPAEAPVSPNTRPPPVRRTRRPIRQGQCRAVERRGKPLTGEDLKSAMRGAARGRAPAERQAKLSARG
jgi:hypothetical protein